MSRTQSFTVFPLGERQEGHEPVAVCKQAERTDANGFMEATRPKELRKEFRGTPFVLLDLGQSVLLPVILKATDDLHEIPSL